MKRVKRMLSHYDQLIARLKRKKYANIVEPLKKLISEVDFNKIISFLLKSSIIKTISLGGAYRFDKRETKLPRTLTILRSEEGEFGCILETKKRLANNQIQQLPLVGGSCKTGKPAWEISGALHDIETELFNLVVQHNGSKERIEIEQEADFSRQFHSQYIHQNKQGVFFANRKYEEDKKNQRPYKISLYSIKAECDLFDYLSSNHMKLPPAIKENMISQLLQGVKVLHENGFVHQDLTLANVLVYKNGNLALTDFGLYAIHEEDQDVMATAGYHSPEIGYFYSHCGTSQYEYFYQHNSWDSSLYEPYVREYREKKVERTQFGTPHKANDMWALGIIIYKIYYGEKKWPDLFCDKAKIESYPLLAGLLAPWREDRLAIEQAIDLHEKTKVLKEEEEQDEKPIRKRRRIR